jgi:diguanylate cyclase (GGDEF)-like protein/PAS domain S-box-containing protein
LRTKPSGLGFLGLAAIAIVVILAPLLAGWTESARMPVLAGLALGAMLTSLLGVERASERDRAVMPPSFIVVFATLLLLGPNVALLAAAAAALTPAFATCRTPRQALVSLAVAVSATETAALAHAYALTTGIAPVWPWLALPVAAAVVAYYLLQSVLVELAIPLLTKQPIHRAWAKRVGRGCPLYVIGASTAAAVAVLIEQRMWTVLPVVGASLALGYQIYVDYVERLEEGRQRGEVLEFLEQGMSVLDHDGRITLWSDAAERVVGCTRESVLGQLLDDAVPALGRTDLPRVIKETIGDGKTRTIAHLSIPSAAGTRLLQVKVIAVPQGVTLLWHDITERTNAEHEMRRSGERLALAAEGANDGLWQWNLETQEFYVSGRWRAMIGLSPEASTGRPQAWLERVHPEDIADLRQKLEAHLAGQSDVFQHEHRIRHEDGTYRRFLCRGVAVSGSRGKRVRIAGSLTDTTEQAIAQERLRTVGFLDPLTGLYNRAVFVEGLGRRLEEFRLRRISNSFAVLYLDLDRFKIVNDSLGHLVGDQLLIEASRRLESCLRPGDALARLGGDEFAVLLNGLNDDAQANAIAFRIQESLSLPFSIGGREVFTSASIGIAFGPAHYSNPDEVMRDADTAMYHAKSRGKARHEVFDEAMHARVRDRLSLENDLRRAIASNGFEVHYQPIVLLATGMCVGFESLVRWRRNGEAISPATFVPIAEELGLIDSLGTWVMEQACQTFADWQRRYPAAGLDCITVNVSSRQLVQQNFPRVVRDVVHTTGLKPADLRVEITETALLDNPGEAAGVLRELRNFGVKVYLDDFGTGYSSLSHLHKLPVDALKIDRSFVKSLLLPDRPAIVESILALARTLNTSVVAEGIEDDIQARALERLGCTHAQGFLFSRPLPTDKAEELIKARRPLGPKGAARVMSVA